MQERSMIYLPALTQYIRMTDGRTDGRAELLRLHNIAR